MPARHCDKFRYLASEALDRELGEKDSAFLERHRASCESCRQHEDHQQLALNMLRSSAMDVEPEPTFDRRVVRMIQVDRVRESFRYWSPAAVGATLAAVLVIALVQIMAAPSGLPERKPTGEARNSGGQLPAIPDISSTKQ